MFGRVGIDGELFAADHDVVNTHPFVVANGVRGDDADLDE